VLEFDLERVDELFNPSNRSLRFYLGKTTLAKLETWATRGFLRIRQQTLRQ